MNSCRVSDVLDSIAPNADDSGVCASTPEGKARIIADLDLGLEALMKRIDNDGTTWTWAIPVNSGCFYLPEDCVEARQIFVNGFSAVMRDQYYQGQLALGQNHCGTQCAAPEVIDMGEYAIPRTLPNRRPIYVTLIAEMNSDAGKQVTVEIINNYGERKTETLTLLNEQRPVQMETSATDVTFVGKPQTDGPIKMYLTYDNGQRFYLCEYGPKVQSGAFRRKKLPQRFMGCNLIRVYGKRRYFRITSENDIIPICDRLALSFVMSAITAMRRQDVAGYNSFLTFAVNELYKGIEDKDSAGAVSPIKFVSGFCGDTQAAGCKTWN